ncbi:MAG: transposase [Deltaproteobacteria bacterium]|jgi:hypothetical protein|nr:transposase [Deltaproteobacteria bacterium]
MPIPQDILSVERPTNTVVTAYGKNKNLYAVRKRTGCRYVGGRRVPINGPTIGHIIDGMFVPIDSAAPGNVSVSPADLKDWANVVLCDDVNKDMIDELCQVYGRADALKIYCVSTLRVCDPGIKDHELKNAYDASFLSEIYSGVALSKNAVCDFLNDLGRTCSRIVSFMRNRTAAVDMSHHLLIDGTLKSDESKVNSLSDFSRKARAKRTRDISVLYAFDLESMEPICSKCFPGNMPDMTSYEAFISENRITKGVIVADKGFPASAAGEYFRNHPDLHYLNPIKRNAKVIDDLRLLDFTDILDGYDGVTYVKKEHARQGKWLYSYRDAHRAAKEEQDWLRRAKKKGNFDYIELQGKQRVFGTMVLECDLDLSAGIIYKAYEKRWEIEIVMRYYKSALEFDETRVHDDYSVMGSEFCDFLSTVLTFKQLRRFDKVKILEKYTYKKIMSVLTRAKKVRLDGDNWNLIKINPSYEEMLKDLGILPKPDELPKQKRGRPRKTDV